MLDLTERELGYIEGLIDGEGRLGIARRRDGYSFHLAIYNTNLEVLEWIQSKVGGRTSLNIEPTTRRKACWVLEFSLKELKRLLPLLKLKIKRKQQEILLQALKHKDWCKRRGKPLKGSRRMKYLYERMKRLNKRGGDRTLLEAYELLSDEKLFLTKSVVMKRAMDFARQYLHWRS